VTLGERLTETARKNPRRTALIFGKRKITYREFDAQAEGFAAGLNALGIGPGDRVGILLGNSPEFAVTYFGIVKAGAAAVPLNTFLTVHELEYIITDSGIRALVSSGEFRDRLNDIIESEYKPEHIINVPGDGDVIGSTPFGLVVKDGSRGAGAAGSEEPAAILYTSGTTGRPKGAVLTHDNLLSNASSAAEAYHVTKRDRLLLFLPMFHAFSFLVCMLLPVSVGASVIILKGVKPFDNVVKAVLWGRATFFVAIPAVYNLLAHKKFPRLVMKLLALRICVSGAAPLPADTLTRFSENIGIPLLEGYGMTETSPVVSCNPLVGIRKPGSVGIPIPGVEVKVAGEDERELGPHKVGEIIVKGPNVMRGYLNNEQATAETIKDGWLFTGDMGYMDEDGYIFVVDRKKDMILVHGMNVYPREIEEVLYGHPDIKDAAVIGVRDEDGTETPTAFVTLNDGAGIGPKDVKVFLRERLAQYKVPRRIEFMDELPMTPTGKVLKKELKRLHG
jgi:long-chain acyl-CoA synthetase